MLKDRLIQARKAAKKTQLQVAEAVGMTQSNYSQLETGRAVASAMMPAIADYLKVNALWLQTGTESSTQMMRIDAWDSDTPVDDDEVSIPFYKDFLLACGSGTIGEAMATERRRLRLSKSTLREYNVEPQNAVAMTAFGDSMKSVINDKATVYVDLGRTKAVDGKIYAIDHGGVFKFKYLYNMPLGGLRIVSENFEEYPEEKLTSQDIIDQEFKILGYAFNVQNRLP